MLRQVLNIAAGAVLLATVLLGAGAAVLVGAALAIRPCVTQSR